MLQLLYDRLQKWHTFPAIIPTRVGTRSNDSPLWVWGRLVERRIVTHPGWGDVEYRLPGATESYTYVGAACIERPMNF